MWEQGTRVIDCEREGNVYYWGDTELRCTSANTLLHQRGVQGGGVERASYRSHDNSGGGGGVRVRGRITSLLPQNNNTANAESRAGYNTRHTHSQHYYKDDDSWGRLMVVGATSLRAAAWRRAARRRAGLTLRARRDAAARAHAHPHVLRLSPAHTHARGGDSSATTVCVVENMCVLTLHTNNTHSRYRENRSFIEGTTTCLSVIHCNKKSICTLVAREFPLYRLTAYTTYEIQITKKSFWVQ